MTSKFRGIRLEFHILQSFPVSCLNRDDVGSPKSALIGGVPRARVSSQCWKRAVRLTMHDLGVQIAERTKLIKDKLFEQCRAIDPNTSEDIIGNACNEAVKALTGEQNKENKKGKGNKADDTQKADSKSENDAKALFFISNAEAVTIAKVLVENQYKCPEPKKIVSLLKERKFSPELDGLDISLFGRMVASQPDLNTEAAAAFAHAISTHRVSPELDFFTAVEERRDKDEAGAGHMGLLEFNSATYYRYISLDLGQLAENLRSDDIVKAVQLFTKALFIAVPVARQKTMAATCPWDYAIVTLRKGQGMQLSFNTPVRSDKDKGIVENSIDALKNRYEDVQRMYASLFGLLGKYELGVSNGSIDELCSMLEQKLSAI